MNNGKVRIYELSKELNLDNRDILAVCDKLNISVKSHSSTITEDEAARIRTAAEKYTPSYSPSKPAAPIHSSVNKQSSPQPPVKKQQILEIRKHRPLAEPPKRPEAEPTPPTVNSGAKSAAPQPSKPLAKPSVPSRPPAQTDLEPVDELESLPPVADLEQELSPDVEPIASSPSGIDSDVDIDIDVDIDVDVARDDESVELTPPPARPVHKAPEKGVEIQPQTNLSNRPVLKRSRTTESAEQSSTSRDVVRPRNNGGTSSEAVATKELPRRSESAGSASPPLIKPKPTIPELRRKPVRPGAEPLNKDAEDVDGQVAAPAELGGTPESIDLELRRPAPPRPPKRGKGWEEEEEEEQESQKASKVGPKAKRRAQPVIDDEEEIDLIDEILEEDDEDDGEDSPVQVSLSLARPPKPKRSAQSKPAVASTPQKPKRSGESRSFRRDRRQEEVQQRPEELVVSGAMSVYELAGAMIVPETDIIKTLFFKGIAANINQILDIPTITMVAEEFEMPVRTVEVEAEAKKTTEMLDASDLDSLQRRPPVVTIMGHVDHGKTTLLDSIRKTKVAQGEAGGITQHIGAYHVDVEVDDRVQQVVFLDTPGHEAFTAMRARGARVTDIAVLVVAADDGVRPQTIEAISHAKAAGVPIVVAINKIDKEEAQPERVKQELTEYGLVAEEWGGDTIMVPVSAIKGENLDTLLEMILLIAEVEDLHANPDRLSRGTVIEANLDKARGPVATLIVQNGTLRVGDILVAGSTFGKVRAMIDDRGKRVEVASPSFAVEVLGLGDVPAAGDEFEVYKDEKEARSIAANRTDQQRQSRLQQAMASRRVSLNTISAQAQEGELKELNLILKADVQGSVEAILGALQQLPQREVQVRVLLAAPGEITETDVDLAAASSAVIVGFSTTFASGARHAADELGVDVRDYNIIYKLLEDVQGAMEGLLEPELVEEHLGQAEVRAVFPVGRGTVAGCYIQSGKMIRNCKVRVLRGKDIVYEGSLDSLKRMKEDVKEVNAGYECGVGVDSFKEWAIGDIIEAYRLVTKRRTLSA
ncbi:MAG: translation initiation factor IF-2 [Cyanobacteria bacterium CRU_2_1]|nr:translation initiation factor IF-2 [Cyanobacteria bacterium RU_5_0]NJR61570.1 translation initiation factor IF-2 [Cyanobacteria bacterium CRU_2_1]